MKAKGPKIALKMLGSSHPLLNRENALDASAKYECNPCHKNRLRSSQSFRKPRQHAKLGRLEARARDRHGPQIQGSHALFFVGILARKLPSSTLGEDLAWEKRRGTGDFHFLVGWFKGAHPSQKKQDKKRPQGASLERNPGQDFEYLICVP